MGFLEEFRHVLATLKAQRFRTVLTLLGIILGVSTLVALSSAVESAGKYMNRGLQEASGEDIITLQRRWWDDDSHKKSKPLNHFDTAALNASERLDESLVLNRYTMRVPWGVRWGQNIWTVGTQEEALTFYNLVVAKGRFISQADLWARTPVAVLGANSGAKLLPGEEVMVGKEIKLKGQRFKVVGVMKKKPAMGKGEFWTWDDSVIVPETAFVDRFSRSKDVREIVVRAPARLIEERGLGGIVATAKAIVKSRHNNVANFKITDPAENAKSQGLTKLIAGGLEAVIAGICLVVGGINLMNIMLVSVLQRTREIGVRRALGATRGHIRRSFLTEAALLASVGGALGVLFGVAFAFLLALVLDKVFGYWPFMFPAEAAILGMTSALVTGIVFGLFPANRAANLSPIDCLRYE